LATAERINSRFGTPQYQPIVLLNTHFDPADIHLYLRAADLCYVGSLHDGMNLVAKEFVVARDDERGVLILSQFAGAVQQLDGVLRVDPYAIDDCAAALLKALSMSAQDQAQRLRLMRSAVAQFDVYRWAGEILTDAAHLRRQRDQLRRPSVGGTRSLFARRSGQNAVGGRRMSDVGVAG
jgi:trehalose 6-phosphate synthase